MNAIVDRLYTISTIGKKCDLAIVTFMPIFDEETKKILEKLSLGALVNELEQLDAAPRTKSTIDFCQPIHQESLEDEESLSGNKALPQGMFLKPSFRNPPISESEEVDGGGGVALHIERGGTQLRRLALLVIISFLGVFASAGVIRYYFFDEATLGQNMHLGPNMHPGQNMHMGQNMQPAQGVQGMPSNAIFSSNSSSEEPTQDEVDFVASASPLDEQDEGAFDLQGDVASSALVEDDTMNSDHVSESATQTINEAIALSPILWDPDMRALKSVVEERREARELFYERIQALVHNVSDVSLLRERLEETIQSFLDLTVCYDEEIAELRHHLVLRYPHEDIEKF